MNTIENLGFKMGECVVRFGRTPSIVKIERMTNTQVIISGGEKFQRSSGRKIGGDAWNMAHIALPKEGQVESIRRSSRIQSLCSKFRDFRWNSLPIETLETVEELIINAGVK